MTELSDFHERALRRGESIALDSSALIAYLAGEEPYALIVAQLIESPVNLVLPAIATSEALVRIAREQDRDALDTIVASFGNAPNISIVSFDIPQLIETALLRAEANLKFPDAAIIATARLAGAIAIVGNDRAWKNRPLGIQYIHLDDVMRDAKKEEG